MSLTEVLGEVEAAGIALRLDGEKVRIWFPNTTYREQLAQQVAFLRSHREEVSEFLRTRHSIPAMPICVRLVAWNLKQPPVAIETCAVVIDSGLFARRTLEQLRIALTQPKRRLGWTIPQLLERLAQVGVIVSLEPESSA
jgi:hypothetical protein